MKDNYYSYLNSSVYERYRKKKRRETIEFYILGTIYMALNFAVSYGILRLIIFG